MKKNVLMIAMICVSMIIMSGCTDNTRANNFGGTSTEYLPIKQKLMNVTWKDNQLWILTRKMNASDVAESYDFIERSSLGIFQGKVIIVEQK